MKHQRAELGYRKMLIFSLSTLYCNPRLHYVLRPIALCGFCPISDLPSQTTRVWDEDRHSVSAVQPLKLYFTHTSDLSDRIGTDQNILQPSSSFPAYSVSSSKEDLVTWSL